MTQTPHNKPTHDEPDHLPGEPLPGSFVGRFIVCLILVLAIALVWYLFAGGGPAQGAEWEVESQRILAGPDRLKADLVRQAVAHEAKPWRAHTVYYHPLEAGSGYRRWVGTATGTLVRPGVASCSVAARHSRTGLGAWIWFQGHGICKVEDNFPESSSPTVFDLAPWLAYPSQNYGDWLMDLTRVAIARTRNLWTDAVLLKPRHGWNQLTSEPK